MNLWENVPGVCEEVPMLTPYIPENKTSDGAVVVLPGGGYSCRAEHEGKGYAEFLNSHGITAFVVDYRVAPHRFPLPLIDARRAVQTVRFMADEYKIDKNKIAIMGSSAGGHLASLTSTYFEKTEFDIDDEISKESFIPDFQILCYPVIKLHTEGIGHIGSGINLLGDGCDELKVSLSTDNLVSAKTPPAFIWHTFEDAVVNIIHTLDYAKALKKYGIPTEIHIYPDGPHGMGVPMGDDKVSKHNFAWSDALINWLMYVGF